MGVFKMHKPCPNPECKSSDAFAVYANDGGGYCWACGFTEISEERKAELEAERLSKKSRVRKAPRKEEQMAVELKQQKPAMTTEEWAKIKGYTTNAAKGFRSIRDDTYETFGVRHAYDESTGQVDEQYYPCTQEGQLVGVKIREVPKHFRSEGRTGQDCELFMQFKFNRGGKYVVITEGEIDALSAYQMLNDYAKGKGSPFEFAVVSPTTGANSDKQIAAQYKFFDSFDNIILSYDADAAGEKAVESVVKCLPKGKVKIMKMKLKDANEYLKAGKERDFITDFYNAKAYTPVGVLGSGELYDRILEQARIQKVRFPPFMKKLNEMLVGGLPLGHIINIAAGTGLGKTSFVNEIIYDWIFSSPHLIGIVSMELDAGQYGETLLSRHLSRKLSLIADDEAKQTLLKSDRVKEKAAELFYKNDHEHRFYLLDNRDGTIEEIQDTIEELVVSCGCKVIVLDPLQDIIDGLSVDEQAVFMKWCKGIIKSHGVTLVLINHIRKATSGGAQSSKGQSYSEEEIQGSSTIIKSASANILLSRDKTAEDPIERNTTHVMLSKNRICGITGPAGEVYYDNESHTLFDKEEYFRANPPQENTF